MKPTLLILAAGMGSRFGGLKQLAPIGPNGETILEYSIFDAIRAGFGKVVFVIRNHFSEEFKNLIEPKISGKIEIEYVFQELDKLPEGYTLPEEREKPWGTGHAILMAKEVIDGPFAVINADDFYGFDAYKTMVEFFRTSANENEYSMIGYLLKNTLSEFGAVSRGICKADANGNLVEITETHGIAASGGKIVCQTGDGRTGTLDENILVSMNFWGFKQNLFGYLENLFISFLNEKMNVPKSEFYIPFAVFDLIQAGTIQSKVLQADSPWFGVTYKEDQPHVIEKITNLVRSGVYPEKLWK
ncbi:MAG: sugar phosphate nucleotidyltransferase [Prolixibacteraceae bacterium]|nr:sugar phosphate nucleotidyltransferase [Prolixibacteraceae bacterium]